MKCDKCGEREAKFSSLGGIELCHICAHDMGLGHTHPDMEIVNPTHALDGFAPKEEIEAHLKEAEG